MHFGSTLGSWNIDLLDIDLLDTNLDSLVGHGSIQISPRCLQDMSSRRLERRKTITLKTCWRHLEDVLKAKKCLLGQ